MMTIANWTILAACVLPVLTVGLAKASRAGQPRSKGGYDNANPREWLAKQTGFQARANAAQQNGFEALPLFIAAVILAQQAGGPQDRIDMLALAFLAARVVYVGMYLANLATLRSLVWIAALGINIALLLQAA